MSRDDGWAALHLEMPPRVPRTEYSAHRHWGLIAAVTGLQVDADSPGDVQQRASSEFIRRWNYDMMWGVLTNRGELDAKRTRMGHAEYAADGVDRDNEVSCPFESAQQVLDFDPSETYGTRDRGDLRRRFERQYAKRCQLWPDSVNMTGVYITLISGLIEIFGWEMLLLAAGTDLERFGCLANRYAGWIAQYFDALGEADVPVVMVHDDIVWSSGAFLHPDWYRRFVFPNYRRLFSSLIESGKRVLFTSDGNYTEFIDDIAACGVHGFVMEPTTDMAAVAATYGRTHVFVGNADTRILLSGTREEIRAEVKRCMDIGKNCPGFFMAVGNHIPANTPVENALYYNEVYEELGRR